MIRSEPTTKGKGKKKKQTKTIDITDFLADTTPTGFSVISSSKLDWADLLDGEEADERLFQSIGTILLPNAPKSTRGPDFDVSTVPTEGPFLAYMRNLPSEVSTDDVIRFFKNLEIQNVDVERGTVPSQTVAIVEFFDREGLIEGLCRNHETMRSREVQISLTDPRNRNRYGDRGGYGNDRDRSGYGERGYGRDRDRGGYNNRERSENTDTGENDNDWRANTRPAIPAASGRDDRYGGRRSGERRWGSGGNFDSGRDGGRDYNREGGRDASRDYGRSGYGNSRGYGYERPADRVDEEPREYRRLQLTKPTKKSTDGDSEFPVAPLNQPLPGAAAAISSEADNEPELQEPPQPQAPLERKRLVLLPPSKKDTTDLPTEAEEGKRSASIFGDAKPVDTTKKLEEFERKQQDRVVKSGDKPLDSRSSDAGSVTGSISGSQSGREPRRIDGGDRPSYQRAGPGASGGGNRNYGNRSNDQYDNRKGSRYNNGNDRRDQRGDYRDHREPREYRNESREYRNENREYRNDNRDYHRNDNRDYRDNRDNRQQRDHREPRNDRSNYNDDQEYRAPRNQGRAPRFEQTIENGIVS